MTGRGEFGLPDAGLVGGVLGIGTCSLPLALAPVPPLDEVAAFGMGFVLAVDTDVITADPAFAVEQSRRELPPVGDFNLLEEFDARRLRGHGRVRGRTASRIACKAAKCKEIKAGYDRPAF